MAKKTCLAFFLILAVLILFWPVQDYHFIIFDDPFFVYENGHIQDGFNPENLNWALTNTDIGFWQPLMWLSLMLDYQLFWMNAGGYHWTNVLFHLVNTLLLFIALQRMTGALGRSAFVALLFGIHPLHVESVAWISERKDVLSIFFWMLTILAYDQYVKKSSAWKYLGVVVCFVLGNMAKSMIMTLPIILLLLDFWPLNRFHFQDSSRENARLALRLFAEKIPLFMVAAVFAMITYASQSKLGAFDGSIPWYQNINFTNPVVSYFRYIWKMIWPLKLAYFYPPVDWSLWQVLGAGAFIAAVTGGVLWRIRRNPYLFVGWGWYIISLLPVIGFLQIGGQSIADRYTYITLIGLFIIITWGFYDLAKNWKYNNLFVAVTSLLVFSFLFTLACIQVRYWKDGITLFTHAVQVTKNNYHAYGCLGASYARSDTARGIEYLKTSLRIKGFVTTFNSLGNALMLQGRYKEAEEVLLKGISLWKRDVEETALHINLGVNYFKMGKLDKAEEEFKKVIQMDPSNKYAYTNMGAVCVVREDWQGAIKAYRDAVRVRSAYLAMVHNDLGSILAKHTQQKEEAIYHLREALRIKPDFKTASDNLKTIMNK